MDNADWSKGLQSNGTYYERWVDNPDELLHVSSHAKATVTCYGTCRSSKFSGNTVSVDKENVSADIHNKVTSTTKYIATLMFTVLCMTNISCMKGNNFFS